ncbi:hypothetical protein V6N13_055137 [Hibiscus sabdariffa]
MGSRSMDRIFVSHWDKGSIMVNFSGVNGQEDIKARKRILESDVLGRWFSRVEEWSVACRVECMYVWLSLYGMLIHAWTIGTFEQIVAHWGSVVRVDEETLKLSSFDRRLVSIETSSLDQMEEMLEIVGAIVHEDKLAAVDCEKETKVGDWMVLRWCIGGENLGKEGAHKVTGLGGEVRSTRELVSELSLQYDVNRDRPPLSNEDSEVEVINYMGNRRKLLEVVRNFDVVVCLEQHISEENLNFSFFDKLHAMKVYFKHWNKENFASFDLHIEVTMSLLNEIDGCGDVEGDWFLF